MYSIHCIPHAPVQYTHAFIELSVTQHNLLLLCNCIVERYNTGFPMQE